MIDILDNEETINTVFKDQAVFIEFGNLNDLLSKLASVILLDFDH